MKHVILISLNGNDDLLYDPLKHASSLFIHALNPKGETIKLTTPDAAKCLGYLNIYKATLKGRVS